MQGHMYLRTDNRWAYVANPRSWVLRSRFEASQMDIAVRCEDVDNRCYGRITAPTPTTGPSRMAIKCRGRRKQRSIREVREHYYYQLLHQCRLTSGESIRLFADQIRMDA